MSDDREREAVAFRKWFESQRRFSSLAAMERALNITEDYLHRIKDGNRRAMDPIHRQKLHEATGLEIFKPITAITEHQAPTLQSTATKSFAGKPDAQSVQKQIRLPENLPTLLSMALEKLKLTLLQSSKKYGISPNMLKKYKKGMIKPSSEKNVTAVLNILNDAQLTFPSGQALLGAPSTVSMERVDLKALTREINALRKKVDEIDRRLSTAKLYEMPRPKQEFMNAEKMARRVVQILVALSNELEFFKQCPESGRMIFRKTVSGPDVGYVTTLLRALFDEDKFQRWLLFSTYEMKGANSGDLNVHGRG